MSREIAILPNNVQVTRFCGPKGDKSLQLTAINHALSTPQHRWTVSLSLDHKSVDALIKVLQEEYSDE